MSLQTASGFGEACFTCGRQAGRAPSGWVSGVTQGAGTPGDMVEGPTVGVEPAGLRHEAGADAAAREARLVHRAVAVRATPSATVCVGYHTYTLSLSLTTLHHGTSRGWGLTGSCLSVDFRMCQSLEVPAFQFFV